MWIVLAIIFIGIPLAFFTLMLLLRSVDAFFELLTFVFEQMNKGLDKLGVPRPAKTLHERETERRQKRRK